jgi:hypothetical protein
VAKSVTDWSSTVSRSGCAAEWTWLQCLALRPRKVKVSYFRGGVKSEGSRGSWLLVAEGNLEFNEGEWIMIRDIRTEVT